MSHNLKIQLSGDPLEMLTSLFDAPCLLPAQRMTLWTIPGVVRPALCGTRFGAGDLLIALHPIMHRPRYYLVWIDAKWFPENYTTSDDFHEVLDQQIWPTLEQEFGSRDSESTARYRWPEVDDEGGCSWRIAVADDILTARARARYAPWFLTRRDIYPKDHP